MASHEVTHEIKIYRPFLNCLNQASSPPQLYPCYCSSLISKSEIHKATLPQDLHTLSIIERSRYRSPKKPLSMVPKLTQDIFWATWKFTWETCSHLNEMLVKPNTQNGTFSYNPRGPNSWQFRISKIWRFSWGNGNRCYLNDHLEGGQ